MKSAQYNTSPLTNMAKASETTPAPRWSGRVQKVLVFFSPELTYVKYTDAGKPCSFNKECSAPNAELCRSANDKWQVGVGFVTNKQESTSLQMGVVIQLCIWNRHAQIQGSTSHERIQARKGIDYEEIFSLVVEMTTFQYLLGFVGVADLHVKT